MRGISRRPGGRLVLPELLGQSVEGPHHLRGRRRSGHPAPALEASTTDLDREAIRAAVAR